MRTTMRVIAGALLLALVLGGWPLGGLPTGRAQGGAWAVSVFDNPDLAGAPRYTTTVSAVSFIWPYAPVLNGVDTAGLGVPVDRFSVRFMTNTFFGAGTYRFTVQVDDGARLYVDGALLINQWTGGALRTFQADANFAAGGNHTVTVEMYDNVAESGIIASWALVSGGQPAGGTPWYAEYFGGLDLSGGPVYTAYYAPSGLNLAWGQGSPAGSVPADNFSARFVRTVAVPQDMPEGMYRFYALADDNFRLRIDSTVILDQWETFAGSQVYTADVPLLPGAHTFTFEYRERTVNASLYLTWSPPNAQNPVLAPPSGVPQTGGGGGGPVAPSGITATVNVFRLNFREAPSLRARVIAVLNRGEVYAVTGRSADGVWARVLVGGTTGWVYRQFVTIAGDFNAVPVVEGPAVPTPTPAPPAVGVLARAAYSTMRVRSAPSLSAPTIGRVPWGTTVEVLNISPNRAWIKVRYGTLVGWSSASWYRVVQGRLADVPVSAS